MTKRKMKRKKNGKLIFEIGDNQVMAVKKILNHWKIKKQILIKKEKMHEAKFLSLNINKAKRELNWKPKLSLNQTIGFTIDWYKSFFESKEMQKLTS